MIQNINPKIWGRKYWNFMESYVKSYPANPTESEKHIYFSVLYGILISLPCEKCRNDTQNQLKKFPLDANALTNNQTLNMWYSSIKKSIDDKVRHEKELNNKTNDVIKCDNHIKIYTIILLFLIIIILIAYSKLR